ncbi:MAG: hypothetical protein FD153_1231 [Rhodospirillaceae bacterium]|nr:MAG: hypothetical protein FD153_1231 [Rhodospirillaceae bacterium]
MGTTTVHAPPIDKLSLVVFSGEFDKVHYALLLASAALAANIPVTLFFTMWACQALCRPGKISTAPEAASFPSRDQHLAEEGIATFEELLAATVALGGRFIVCETGLKAMGLTVADLRPDVPVELAGAVTFLVDSSHDGGLMFI